MIGGAFFVFALRENSAFRGRVAGSICAVRVPLPVVIPFAIALVAVVWWRGTVGMDFLTPPGEQELVAIRQRVEASMPQPDRPPDAISVPSGPSPAPAPRPVEAVPKPVIEPADLESVPGLAAYAELAPKGAAYLVELAALLETRGEVERALLVWERVLDAVAATPEETARAVSATRRLRPTLPAWNIDLEGAIRVVLHAGTAGNQAEALEPIMREVARIVTHASSGILEVTHKVTASQRDAAADAPPPVAIRLAGEGGAAPSTEVLSFRPGDPDALVDQFAGRVFQLVSNYLERAGEFAPPPPLASGESAAEALEFRISRLVWKEFGLALNPQPEDFE